MVKGQAKEGFLGEKGKQERIDGVLSAA